MEFGVVGKHYETPCIGTHPPGMALNRLLVDVGRFRSFLHKWGLAPSAACEWAQKNKPSTMLSSNTQCIDSSMDCTT